jgi:double-stranded RNA-binding protein Staufen
MYMVCLRVGAREYLGDGPTAQAARHDAASKALHHLKSLPMPEDSLQHCSAGMQENGKERPANNCSFYLRVVL